jgi:N-dimethylarginine dimethylaminohydrolase
LLADAGVEVIAAGPDPDGLLDAMFAFDSSIMSDAGAIILRSGKDLRLPEADTATQTYDELGIPIAGRITAPGTVDGGDTLWIDPQTLAVGRSYRTNDEGLPNCGPSWSRRVCVCLRSICPIGAARASACT